MSEPQTQVNVTQKRGCTCCGTGCAVVAVTAVMAALLVRKLAG